MSMYLIREIDSEEEIRTSQRLRANVYLREGLEVAKNFIDGRLVDPDDDSAIHFGAFNLAGDRMLGSFKLSVRGPDRPMRVEKFWPRSLFRPGVPSLQAEMARLAVLPQYRRAGLSLGLWQICFQTVSMLGVTHTYAMQREGPLGNQEAIGMPVKRLAPPIAIHGFSYTPTVIHVPEVLPNMVRVKPQLALFFSRPMHGGIFESRSIYRPPARELAEFTDSFMRLQAVPNPISA